MNGANGEPIVNLRAAETSSDRRVLDQLAHLLDSRAFKASPRRRELLSHLVLKAQRKETDTLTQRHLARAVFSRGAEFDPHRDAIVRIEVGKLRRALEQYYLHAGADDPVVITIPRGSYTPTFHVREYGSTLIEHTLRLSHPNGIAVLPFIDISDDQNEFWLADGLREELTQILTRIPELKVLSRHAIEPLISPRPNLDAIGQLGARFFLEGSIRRLGTRLRVSARLYDHKGGRECWADSYDRDLSTADLLDLQSDIAQHVVSQSADLFTGVLGRQLKSELGANADSDFRVYESILRFHHYLHQTSAPAYTQARTSLERAIEIEPNNALVLSMLGDLRRAAWSFGYTDEPSQLASVVEMQQKALELAPECAPCRISYGFTLLQQRKLDALREITDTIIADHASPASYRADAAVLLGFTGDWDRSCEVLQQLLPTMNGHPGYFDYPMVFKAYRDENYQHALALAKRLKPAALFWQPLMRAACMGQLGMTEEAQAELTQLTRLRPDFERNGKRFVSCFVSQDDLVAKLIEGLRKAGLQVRVPWT